MNIEQWARSLRWDYQSLSRVYCCWCCRLQFCTLQKLLKLARSCCSHNNMCLKRFWSWFQLKNYSRPFQVKNFYLSRNQYQVLLCRYNFFLKSKLNLEKLRIAITERFLCSEFKNLHWLLTIGVTTLFASTLSRSPAETKVDKNHVCKVFNKPMFEYSAVLLCALLFYFSNQKCYTIKVDK